MLTLQHVDKTYNPGSVNALPLFQNFNLEVREHEFITVVGSNGSGKSSLLQMICGSIPIDAGRLHLRGRDITGMPEHARAAFIGRVFQDPSRATSPSMTIMENLSLCANKGKRYGLGRGVNSRDAARFQELLSQLKLGLEDKLHVPVGALSGGQRQALSLLIATLSPIDLLILDEHTAALDPSSSETIMHLTDTIVREKGITTLMVTHNLKYAVEYGNRLLMMHQGEVIIDACQAKKQEIGVGTLLDKFCEISVELGN